MAIHLSINNLARVVRALTPHYGADCPVVVAYRVSWPDERLIHGTLGDIRDKVKEARITRTALILVGRALAGQPRPKAGFMRPITTICCGLEGSDAALRGQANPPASRATATPSSADVYIGKTNSASSTPGEISTKQAETRDPH